jgi:hypothetical protein
MHYFENSDSTAIVVIEFVVPIGYSASFAINIPI